MFSSGASELTAAHHREAHEADAGQQREGRFGDGDVALDQEGVGRLEERLLVVGVEDLAEARDEADHEASVIEEVPPVVRAVREVARVLAECEKIVCD